MFYPFIFLFREMIEGLYCFCCISQSFKELIFVRYHYYCESECKDKGFILISQTF